MKFGPQYVPDARRFWQAQLHGAEQIIKLLIRTRLCELDPSLPHYLDDVAWMPLEREWAAR